MRLALNNAAHNVVKFRQPGLSKRLQSLQTLCSIDRLVLVIHLQTAAMSQAYRQFRERRTAKRIAQRIG